MIVCPYCYIEAIGIGCGDECLDYCDECDKVIEGCAIDVEKLVARNEALEKENLKLTLRSEFYLAYDDLYEYDRMSVCCPTTAAGFKAREESLDIAYQACLEQDNEV